MKEPPMNRAFAALAGVFLSLQPALAECVGNNLLDALPPTERAALDAKAAEVPYPQGNYWRATKGDQTVTIIGTYHLEDPRHEATRAIIAPAISAASTVLVEAGPDEEAQLMARMAEDPGVMMITDGPTLMEQMPPEDWDRLAAAMSERQIPAFMAAKFQPWYVTMMLSIPPCGMADLVDAHGLDASVIAAAQAENIPLRALEPYDTIFSIFGGMTGPEQLEMIRTTLAMEDQAVDMSITLADAYFAEDSRVIWEFMKDQMLDAPGYTAAEVEAEFAQMEEALMSARNRAWIPVIEGAAQDGPVFAAFGALHLSGHDGVLALMERAGWTLERLPL
jgi:uncharacterized protein